MSKTDNNPLALALRSEILKHTAFAPRAHLEGIELPSSFKLPSLTEVSADISQLAKIQREGGPEEIRSLFVSSKPGAPPPGRGEAMSEPMRYNVLLANLFRFSYFARSTDVPDSILEPVIFALKMFIRVMEEGTEQQLRGMGHILPNQTLEFGKYFILSNARYKVITHLLHPDIDRADEALPYLTAAMEADMARKGMETRTPWVENPFLWWRYGDALVWTGEYADAKPVLENVLAACSAQKINMASTIIRVRIQLAQVLAQLGEEKNEHIEWAAKYLRKNPKILPPPDLTQLLAHKGQPAHPVLRELGGMEWLLARRTTVRTEERQAKQCRQCGAREPQKKLFRCSQCQHIWYCSKECQKQNWKLHKENAQSRERAELLKLIDPSKAQKAADWLEWRNLPHEANTYALAHALGLRRDPSRGRTHIVFRQVEWVPRARDMRHRFRVRAAGVFRITDVLRDIESIMQIGRGEGREYVDGLLEELDGARTGREIVPILDITTGEGIETWMGSSGLTLDRLRGVPYDPNWRKIMNKGEAAGPLRPKSGAPDAENIF
ncbi:hypothetical protein FA95DRAFT_1481533 [Auriscalpium vulgare]|uniref:Uncharacterized protein n=1 Tax=Auriscalpium vulgare TaxID=40419 RepID=A0ACB8SCA3_9AGAM|nr:hypothetical protein FA95DRAFT_1481533 [Auriscalpium vulgare]